MKTFARRQRFSSIRVQIVGRSRRVQQSLVPIEDGGPMVDVQEITPRPGDVMLMVGTTKGAFLFRAPATRGRWERGGPHFPGHAVYAMAYDGREGRRRVWAAPESSHWGSVMRSS